MTKQKLHAMPQQEQEKWAKEQLASVGQQLDLLIEQVKQLNGTEFERTAQTVIAWSVLPHEVLATLLGIATLRLAGVEERVVVE